MAGKNLESVEEANDPNSKRKKDHQEYGTPANQHESNWDRLRESVQSNFTPQPGPSQNPKSSYYRTREQSPPLQGSNSSLKSPLNNRVSYDIAIERGDNLSKRQKGSNSKVDSNWILTSSTSSLSPSQPSSQQSSVSYSQGQDFGGVRQGVRWNINRYGSNEDLLMRPRSKNEPTTEL
ncbi:unnamed protein product [Owenia fusiformis]|uniref:Uncharacterized protein n=1 Tax=Owenia fusiformis TaxID=6347 RepID=A0A8J1TA56_OWEFU|nr:unnamed protein product [Owenia fusiformis]